MRFSKIESNKLSTDMSLTKWKQTNSAIFSALFFISKVRFKPCWVMQATIIICRIKKLWQYLPWTLSFSFTYTYFKETLFEINAAAFCWYFLVRVTLILKLYYLLSTVLKSSLHIYEKEIIGAIHINTNKQNKNFVSWNNNDHF